MLNCFKRYLDYESIKWYLEIFNKTCYVALQKLFYNKSFSFYMVFIHRHTQKWTFVKMYKNILKTYLFVLNYIYPNCSPSISRNEYACLIMFKSLVSAFQIIIVRSLWNRWIIRLIVESDSLSSSLDFSLNRFITSWKTYLFEYKYKLVF